MRILKEPFGGCEGRAGRVSQVQAGSKDSDDPTGTEGWRRGQDGDGFVERLGSDANGTVPVPPQSRQDRGPQSVITAAPGTAKGGAGAADG